MSTINKPVVIIIIINNNNTATAITKRNTVNKENLTNKKVLRTYKKGLLSHEQDLLTYTKRDLLTNTKDK